MQGIIALILAIAIVSARGQGTLSIDPFTTPGGLDSGNQGMQFGPEILGGARRIITGTLEGPVLGNGKLFYQVEGRGVIELTYLSPSTDFTASGGNALAFDVTSVSGNWTYDYRVGTAGPLSMARSVWNEWNNMQSRQTYIAPFSQFRGAGEVSADFEKVDEFTFRIFSEPGGGSIEIANLRVVPEPKTLSALLLGLVLIPILKPGRRNS